MTRSGCGASYLTDGQLVYKISSFSSYYKFWRKITSILRSHIYIVNC